MARSYKPAAAMRLVRNRGYLTLPCLVVQEVRNGPERLL